MGLFGRRSSEQQETDAALTFFTVQQADDFRSIARQVFAEHGLEVTVHADHAVDDGGRQFGFWNVAAQCAQTRRARWPATVREHVGRVLADMDAPDPFAQLDRENVAGRVHTRLYPEDGLPTPDRYPHREFAPGIVEMLALDLPDSVVVFDHDNAARLGGWEALRAQGVANLRALPVERLESLQAPGGGQFHALLGESVYTASRAVLLPALATELEGRPPATFGWLMSVPNRHQVAWHVIRDSTVVTALNGLAHFTALGHSDAPGPVSPYVYWWNGSTYEQLTHIDQDGTISVHAGEAFTDVLNAVVDDG
jgi:hypothetical protein